MRHYNSAARLLLLLLLAAGCHRGEDSVLHVIYTGGISGYVEPCGCREGRMGGLARLAGSVADSLNSWKSPAVIVDAGDFAETYGSDSEAKNRLLLRAFALLDYDAINVAAQDIIAGLGTLKWAADSLKLPLISANLRALETGELVFPGWVIKNAGRYKVGIIGVGMVRPLEMRRARADSLAYDEPETAIRQALEEIGSKCDLIVLLCDFTARSSREIAQHVPSIDIVISSRELAPSGKVRRFGHAYVLGTGRKGKAITSLALRELPGDSLAIGFSQALLDSTAKEDSETTQLIDLSKNSNNFSRIP